MDVAINTSDVMMYFIQRQEETSYLLFFGKLLIYKEKKWLESLQTFPHFINDFIQ